MVTKGVRDRYMLLYTKEMKSKDILYSTGNYRQYPIIKHNGKTIFLNHSTPSHYNCNKNSNPNLCPHFISPTSSFVAFIHCTLVVLAFFHFLQCTKFFYASRRVQAAPYVWNILLSSSLPCWLSTHLLSPCVNYHCLGIPETGTGSVYYALSPHSYFLPTTYKLVTTDLFVQLFTVCCTHETEHFMKAESMTVCLPYSSSSRPGTWILNEWTSWRNIIIRMLVHCMILH